MATKPNWKLQAILGGSLVVLGTFAYWLEYSHKPKKEAEEEGTKKVFKLKEAGAASIKITGSASDGIRNLEIKCLDATAKLCKAGDNSRWEISQPAQLKADDSNVNSLLSSLNQLSVSDTIDLKEESSEKRAKLLGEYGLSKASKTVEVTYLDGSKTSVAFGEVHPVGGTLFAQASSKPDTVYMLPIYIKATFEHDLTYWRDKKIMTLAAHQIESFTLSGGKAGKIKADKVDGHWTLHAAGEGDLAGDLENIDSLLSSLTYLSAKSFAAADKNSAEAKKALTGAKPGLMFQIEPGKIEVRLFEKKAQDTTLLFATVSNLDPLFELEATARERLDKSLKDLRLSKLITSMERFTSKRVEFSGKAVSGGPLVLVMSGTKWINEKTKADINQDKFQQTLDKLSGNRIKDFTKSADVLSGASEGMLISLGDEKNPRVREIMIWKKGDQLYAKDPSSKRNEAMLIDPAIKDSLPWDVSYFTQTK